MKKLFRLLLSAAFAVCLMLSLSGGALAAGTGLTYSGATRTFTFDSSANLFNDMQGLLPGDTATQNVVIKVDPAPNTVVRIYLRAETADAALTELIDQFGMTVRQGSTVLYDSVSKPAGLADNVLLGEFTAAGSATLTVELSVPITLGNEFADRTGGVNWIFTADEVPVNGGGPVDPTPGDDGGEPDAPIPEIVPDGGVGGGDTPEADFTMIEEGDTPRAGGRAWALLNLLCAIAAVGLGGAMVYSCFRKKDDGEQIEKTAPTDGEGRKTDARKSKLFGLIPAVGSVVLFVLTEDMTAPMTLTDKWTVPMALILAVNGVIAWLTRKKEKEEDEAPASAG